ncbi:MAG: protein-ADP-ribose hydrolase [Lachnospiraceae bacterium]
MDTLEKLFFLNNYLLDEMPQYKGQASQFEKCKIEQARLFRSLVNVRPAIKASEEFIKVQDEYLTEESKEKGIVRLENLTEVKPNIYLWQGDITRLQVDGIVNAANNALLGCFIACHSCIDNAIHTFSGIQLRLACNEIMQSQGHNEETGKAKITKAYNLPSKHVIHTVGPIINGNLTKKDCQLLENCYNECLNLAIGNNLKSIAFCCISTGEFCFPNDKAAQIAVATVMKFKEENKSEIEVIFNVFKEKDYNIYRNLLREDC